MHWSLVPFQIKGIVRHFVADFTGHFGMNLFDVIFQTAFWRHFTTANITSKLATTPMFHNKMFLFPGIRCKCFVAPVTWPPFFNCMTSVVETVQDFLIKLDIKPLMHLLKISIFSLNNDTVRLTKIMNNLVKDCKIRTFKVIFQCLKLVKSFPKKVLWRIFD